MIMDPTEPDAGDTIAVYSRWDGRVFAVHTKDKMWKVWRVMVGFEGGGESREAVWNSNKNRWEVD